MSGSTEVTEHGEELPGADSDLDHADVHTPPKLRDSLLAPVERPREWLYLVENRLVIAAGLLTVVFALLFAVEVATSLSEQGLAPLFYVFGALIGGNFTLVTIVISVSQLVISQQLGSPGDLRRRIEETNEYRQAVEDGIGREVAPVTPTDFLQLLLEQVKNTVETVGDESDALADAEAREDFEKLLDHILAHVEHVNALLERPEVGLFEALSVTLQTNYSMEIYEIRQFQTEHRDEYPEEMQDALDELVVRLQQIDVARQYLKTLYMQDELATVSRLLLYTGIPAVLVSVFMMHQFAASTQAVFSPTILSALVPVALTVGVAPIAVLFAYVLRISTVAQRTVAITPFTTPRQESKVTPLEKARDVLDSEWTDGGDAEQSDDEQ